MGGGVMVTEDVVGGGGSGDGDVVVTVRMVVMAGWLGLQDSVSPALPRPGHVMGAAGLGTLGGPLAYKEGGFGLAEAVSEGLGVSGSGLSDCGCGRDEIFTPGPSRITGSSDSVESGKEICPLSPKSGRWGLREVLPGAASPGPQNPPDSEPRVGGSKGHTPTRSGFQPRPMEQPLCAWRITVCRTSLWASSQAGSPGAGETRPVFSSQEKAPKAG